MAIPVPMLALSPTMTEGTIAAWKFKEGDEIKRGAVLCEVETDKATMDYEVSSQGTLLKIVVPAGGSVKIGDLIAVIGNPGEDISAILAQASQAAKADQSGKPGNTSEASPGPAPVQQATVSQPQNPSAPAPQPPAPGITPIGLSAPGSVEASRSVSAPMFQSGVAPSSPLARKLAQQAGIDLRQLQGSGPGGRIVKRDIHRYRESLTAGTGPGAGPGTTAIRPAVQTGLEERSVSVSRIRQTIARRLGESMREAPHFYLRMAIDMERLINLRNSYNQSRKDAFTISFNAIFMKLAAMAITRHPQINSTWLGDRIQFHSQIDVGLAVALEEGLVAPVVRDCAQKGIEAIERELRDLIARAKEGKLKPDDYEGATFTISNLGAWGVEEFTAIINPPGSAILALGAIKKEAVIQTDPQGLETMVIRPMLRATLSSDHRAIDGAVAAAFMKDLVAFWEDPGRALL